MSGLNQSLADALRNADQAESQGEVQDPSSNLLRGDVERYQEDRPVPADYGNEVSGERIGYSTNYEVNVRPLTSGYILRVGCQEIAVESAQDITKLIEIYLTGGETIGDKWMNSDKNIQQFIKNHLQVK
jgi:hypothetical protein